MIPQVSDRLIAVQVVMLQQVVIPNPVSKYHLILTLGEKIYVRYKCTSVQAKKLHLKT